MKSDFSSETDSISSFIAELESIPWFEHLGDPMPPGADVKALKDWDDWPGPEDLYVAEFCERQQRLYDNLLADAGDDAPAIESHWESIHATVIPAAAQRVPFDPDADSWHPPTAAVWQAAWTAGLVGWCLLLNRKIPEELDDAWQWYKRGRWPCGYSMVWTNDVVGPLIVF